MWSYSRSLSQIPMTMITNHMEFFHDKKLHPRMKPQRGDLNVL